MSLTALFVRRLARLASCLTVAACVAATANAQPASSRPSPWTAQIISDSAPDGSAVRARFIHQPLAGNIQITARVDSLPLRSGAIMLRASLQPAAAHASVTLSATGVVNFHHRALTGGPTTTDMGRPPVAAQWVGLDRKGSRVVAYTSPDGQTWTSIGSTTIELGAVVHAGVVTSDSEEAAALAGISQVSISGLPPAMRERDIGGAPTRGSTRHSEGTFEIIGGGAGISGSHDQFHFVYQAMQGDVEIVARVAASGDATAATAGVMIREGFQPQSPHASALVAGSGYAFDRRTEAGGWTDHTDGGPGRAPGWVRLVRRGATIEAFRSDDGQTWTPMGSAAVPMNDEVYVGLAVASQDAGTTTAVLDGVSIASIGDLLNLPPTATLLTPADGARFTAPATISLTALAADPEGRLANVEFHANGSLIGAVSTLPHALTWSSVPAGSYVLTAVAADADGARTTSAPVSITVESSNPPPSATWLVSFTASADHDANVTSYLLDVFAGGDDPNSASPIASRDLGKPTPRADGEISSDETPFFNALPPGSYVATVAAVGPGGRARSTPAAFTR